MIYVQPKMTRLVRDGHYSSFKSSQHMVHQNQSATNKVIKQYNFFK